ncbi:MAG: cupredoxin domain-containing protein [Gemmatimonadetes bacterium]|nr:cupredoxin domain-containing protein [Gemmatimonadota bacterium]
MTIKSIYSYACSAFAATVVMATLGGCFSERVAGAVAPDATALCAGTQPNVVRIRNFSFGPTEVRVRAGTRVIFANCDGAQHSSTSDAIEGWDSGLISPNTTYERTFDQAGRFPYHCEPHPSMTGTIIVE